MLGNRLRDRLSMHRMPKTTCSSDTPRDISVGRASSVTVGECVERMVGVVHRRY
jgi:hypothetical protein